ncbi:MAG TPA: PilX N-terminal domain-containing pilus assembly protein [Vicinamibacterales bacterium]|nr:PilX N-terminal domain-containing pilus assembly protein [Vicinamibacterales bacterium]
MRLTNAQLRSERGIALVVVLLLMAVLSGLATGFAMNGHVEATMSRNEVYYAGARAAAEAGLNRAIEAIVANTTVDLLQGVDGAADDANLAAVANADNGDVTFLLTGAAPYTLDAAGEYSYELEIFDDDDPVLYTSGVMDADQLARMNENGLPYTDQNDRLILRATGYGPSNTLVRLARVIESQQDISTSPATSLNPAILVNGSLNISGNITLAGSAGSVHTNGDLTIGGNAAEISGDATASGTFTVTSNNFEAGGAQGGGYAAVNFPDIHASDYVAHADFFLNANGTKTKADGTACVSECSAWSWNAASSTWQITGNSANTGTFYVRAKVSISGSPKGPSNSAIAMSVIAEGSIEITGSPKLTPENTAKYQFITDGDLKIGGAADLDDPTQVEGQILVREQLHVSGNPEFQGRILVQDVTSVSTTVVTNAIPGNPTFTYNGSLDAIPVPGVTTTTYLNNAKGWLEQ